jgi:serine/threonine-protein kinase
VLDGRYQVIAPIAEGAMGAVYRGERLKLGRAVAIKIIHDALPDELASRQRFEREAKLMARLEHPHCVSVIDFGLHDGRPFLVMDLVRGTSLLELLDKHGAFETSRACDIARQVLSGLGHAHEIGIIHRDIKPANIMLTQKTGLGEQVRILDFGLARPATETTKLTTGIVVGTPNYMAPEQIRGLDLDGRADLYAVGVMLFELLVGKKPFNADDPMAVVRKHLNEPPPTLAQASGGGDFAELEPVIARALAKNASERFGTAGEMSAAIERAVDKHNARQVANLMSHAVPQIDRGAPPGPQVATMSGWSVPPESGAIPGSVPQPMAAPQTGPTGVPQPMAAPQTGPTGVPQPMAAPPTGPTGVPQTMAAPPTGPTGVPQPMAAPQTGPTAFAGSGPVTGPNVAPQSGPVPQPFESRPNTAPAFVDASAPNDSQAATSLALGAVPQTRRNVVADRPIPQLPLTRRQLMIAGGGLVLLVIIIIAATRGGSGAAAKPIADAAVAQVGDAPAGDPVAVSLARASDLYANGDLEPALQVALRARRDHPDSAQLAFLAGKIYFAKLYWTDGLKQFRDAIRLDPGYRTDTELIKIALRGFITTPDTDSRLEEFLRVDIGEPVRPLLEETARDNPNSTVRARAAAELRRLH